MNFDALSNQALASGNQRQADLNQQSAQTQQQYGQQFASAQAAQNQLQDYTNSIQGGGQQAQDYLSQQYKQLGIDPQAIQEANKQVYQTQANLAFAPQSASQAGNYYGQTAGNTQQIYQGLTGNLNSVLTTQTAKANYLSQGLNQALQNATMIENSQQTSQQQKLSGYQNVANVAQQLAATAGDTMTKIESLAQQQGYVTSETVQMYQKSKADLISANATATTAAAQANLYNQQATYQSYINTVLGKLQDSGQLNQQTVSQIQSILNGNTGGSTPLTVTSGGGLQGGGIRLQ